MPSSGKVSRDNVLIMTINFHFTMRNSKSGTVSQLHVFYTIWYSHSMLTSLNVNTLIDYDNGADGLSLNTLIGHNRTNDLGKRGCDGITHLLTH